MSIFRLSDSCCVLGLLLALVLVGCSDEATKPTCRVGQIHGRVTDGAGNGAYAHLEALEVPWNPDRVRSLTETDADGHYFFSLPPSEYIMSLRLVQTGGGGRAYYSEAGLQYDSADADTLVLSDEQSSIRADVSLGTVDVTLRMPLELEGDSLLVLSHSRGVMKAKAQVLNGEFHATLAGILPGTCRLRISLSGSSIWLPGSRDRADADSFAVVAGAVTTYNATIPAPATIKGIVTGAWREMEEDPPVVALHAADSSTVARTTATETGEFECTMLLPTEVRVRIEVGGVSTWHGGQTFAEATQVSLQPGDVISNMDLQTTGIWGEVLPPMGYAEFASTVVVYLTSGSGETVAKVALVPNWERIFRFPNLTPGTYYIYAAKGWMMEPGDPWYGLPHVGWLPQWYDQADSLASATPVTLDASDEARWIQVTLEEGGRISGKVIDTFGMPVPSGRVRCTSAMHADPPLCEARIRSDGHFVLAGLPDAAYKICAINTVGEWIWHPATADWDSASVVVVEGHGEVQGADILFFEE